ncbi:MAG: polysialic acid transporter [Opitutae bacterium]|nr:polysialic acid transporter [Opitutae bacterium]|tara:strand:- start:1148 stop:1990 length:843 start_codon:yes stop_codon:yes gene_type:complete
MKTTIISVESPLRHPRKLVWALLKDVHASRELAWQLFVRDLKAAYRQSFLGYVWVFLPPLFTTLTFTFLNSQNILSIGDTPIPYPAYAMLGTLLWQNFVDALNSPIKSVSVNKAMLIKVNFPREALVLAGLGEVIFNFLIRLALLIPVLFIYDIPITSTALLFPLGFLGLIILGLAIGLLLTPLAMLFGDVQRGMGLATGIWMLLTPALYPPPKDGFAAVLAQWNPVSPALLTARNWLISQPTPHMENFLIVAGVSSIVAISGFLFYRISMPHLIGRMGA